MTDPLVIAEIDLSSVTRVTRRVDICHFDNVTPFFTNVGVVDGSVTVDASSTEERRNISLSIWKEDDRLSHHPEGLWYDKVIKPYRGLYYKGYSGEELFVEWQLGSFLIDSVDLDHFPDKISLTGRDFSKKLLKNKFGVATTFVAGYNVADLIEIIAVNGGIVDFDFVSTTKLTGKDFVFESDTDRWAAIQQIATDYSFECFFDATGVLVLRDFRDPATTEPAGLFQATAEESNLVSWTKRLSDSRLYNDVVVVGTGAALPIVGRAQNLNPDSPANIFRIGQRTYRYESGFITTQAQADEVAASFLKVHALEEFDVNLTGLMAPWLEAGDIVYFLDPDPEPGSTENRFLLHDFTLPLGFGPMTATCKRVVDVG